jgi:hypothetical protein
MTIDRSDELAEWYAEDDPNGAELLDDLLATYKKYVAFSDEYAPVAATLWTAATHTLPAFECAPRLAITSPQKRCGKTRLLDVIAGTCHRSLATSDATVAPIFRSLGGDHPPTPIIDEADTIWGSKKLAEQNEDLRKLINAGNRRSGVLAESNPNRVQHLRDGRPRQYRRAARHHHRPGGQHRNASPLPRQESVAVPVAARRTDLGGSSRSAGRVGRRAN